MPVFETFWNPVLECVKTDLYKHIFIVKHVSTSTIFYHILSYSIYIIPDVRGLFFWCRYGPFLCATCTAHSLKFTQGSRVLQTFFKCSLELVRIMQIIDKGDVKILAARRPQK